MATTPPNAPSGRDRLAAIQAEQRAKQRRRRNASIAGGLAAVVAIGGGITYAATRHSSTNSSASSSSSGNSGTEGTVDGIAHMRTWSGLGREHVEGDPKFAMTPPVGGNHNQAWANCGVYSRPIPDKYAVHSLEHGAVWITYTPKVNVTDLAKLKSIANQDYMLMSPYPTQDSPIIVSAWGHQIRATSASDPRIQKFVDTYLQGPQTPEPGAACSGAYDPNTGKIAGSM